MKFSLKIIILKTLLFAFNSSFSQSDKVFCNALDNNNFDKLERIVNKAIYKNRKGVIYFNGEGSGYQINFSSSLDSITYWLKRQDCVLDAFWDKCQDKIAIYPGHSSIGIQFNTKTGITEKCFLIQEGTNRQLNLFGWKPKLFKPKKILLYKKMYDCENLIELQKKNCEKMN